MGKIKENISAYSVRKSELLRRTQRRLEKLPARKLALVNDILLYIEQEPSDPATQELLRIPGFFEKFLEAAQEVKHERLVDFQRIRRDV